MAKIIFDIETVGDALSGFDQATQEYFLKFAKTDEEVAQARDSTSFYPVTAKIVTIAMLEAETEKSFVYYLIPDRALERAKEGEAEYVSAGTEKQLLELFWQRLEKYDQVITFNGRGFDAPFIMTRSAIHRLRCTKNLMPDRYRGAYHLDLMEKLTFLGATRRRFGLHMWCNAFGIKSPKEEGVTGLDVKDLFAEGRYFDIARYCLRDVGATKELYLAWDKYMNFPGA
jgi:DNA polymerase elongation subunit (family B)